jgi:hypothetical protein
MSRGQAVAVGVLSGLAVGLFAGLAVVHLDTLRRDAAESDATSGSTVVHGEVYEGDAEQEAWLVQTEAERLVYVRTAAAGAPYAEGLAPGPFRLRTGGGYTLVLPARAEPYGVGELAALAPDTLVRQADADYLLSESVAVLEGATLDIRPQSDDQGLTLRLASDENGFATLVGLGGTLTVTGSEEHPVNITSWNARIAAVDARTADGRAYLRAVGGAATLSYVNITALGFWSGATGGLALTGTGSGSDTETDAGTGASVPDDSGTAGEAPAGAPLMAPPAPSAAPATATTVTATLDGVHLEGNAFGLFVTRAQGVVISDSEVSDSLVDGLVFHRSVTGSRVLRTVSHDNAVDGVRVSRSSVGNVFAGVTSTGNGRNGMFLDGQPLAAGPSSAGTAVRAAGGNLVSDSDFRANARYGVAISGGDGVAVTGSRIDAGENGIVVDKAARDVRLEENTLSGQQNQAIAIRDGVEAAEVSGNEISDVPTGIYVRNAGASLVGNDLERISNHGVTLVGRASGVEVIENEVAGSGSIAVFTEDATGAAVSDNDLLGWQPAPSLESVTRAIFQPLTVVWILVGLAILVTSLSTISRRRMSIRHPYAERVPISTYTSGIVSRDSITHIR